MVFKNLGILVLWTKVALALEGLKWLREQIKWRYEVWIIIHKMENITCCIKLQVNLDMTDHCTTDFCI